MFTLTYHCMILVADKLGLLLKSKIDQLYFATARTYYTVRAVLAAVCTTHLGSLLILFHAVNI